jgi:hypothetical protein
MASQRSAPLLQEEFARPELLQTPLKDRQMLKRIILYSDAPDSEEIKAQAQKDELEGQINTGEQANKKLRLRVCNSQFTEVPIDMTKLQGDTIQLLDAAGESTNSLYEIVANVRYLPNPFSLTKIIEFKSRYVMVNKCHKTLQVI